MEDIWSVSTKDTCCWISKEEYKRLIDCLAVGLALDSNDFIFVTRLDGGETVLRVGAIVSLDHTTAEQRTIRRQNVALYDMEEES